ncbi:hypothetical protein BDZ89DRAFT_1044254 [Hymenopellis radicata]|nr:hypothetical protein BDZ89DRAFT_1044254 [Hymenopellis radicata]
MSPNTQYSDRSLSATTTSTTHSAAVQSITNVKLGTTPPADLSFSLRLILLPLDPGLDGFQQPCMTLGFMARGCKPSIDEASTALSPQFEASDIWQNPKPGNMERHDWIGGAALSAGNAAPFAKGRLCLRALSIPVAQSIPQKFFEVHLPPAHEATSASRDGWFKFRSGHKVILSLWVVLEGKPPNKPTYYEDEPTYYEDEDTVYEDEDTVYEDEDTVYEDEDTDYMDEDISYEYEDTDCEYEDTDCKDTHS